jgi:hypothetical protein
LLYPYRLLGAFVCGSYMHACSITHHPGRKLSLFVGLISLLFGVISGVWNGLALLK